MFEVFKAEKNLIDELEGVTTLTQEEMLEEAGELNIFEKLPAVRRMIGDENPSMEIIGRLDQTWRLVRKVSSRRIE